jgi:hypothetical protein
MNAEIAASIDLTTTDGHNLRALLLNEGKSVAPIGIMARAELLGLVEWRDLTPLGREVAELLRPVPWRTAWQWESNTWRVLSGTDPGWICGGCTEQAAGLIARLLTEHGEREAKQYRTEPNGADMNTDELRATTEARERVVKLRAMLTEIARLADIAEPSPT